MRSTDGHKNQSLSELPPRQPKRLPPLLNTEGSFIIHLVVACAVSISRCQRGKLVTLSPSFFIRLM